MKMRILTKSGHDFSVPVVEFTVVHSKVTGEVEKLHWTTPANAVEKLVHVNIGDIVAIIREGA